jgi:hypothetical protein
MVGLSRDDTFLSASSVAYPTTSIPSKMRYYVMFPHLKYVMLFQDNHICGNITLFMSLGPIVSLLLWGVSSIGYQR